MKKLSQNTHEFKANCAHFRGDVPCRPHKMRGVECSDCSEYSPRGPRILIIKLGAIGDVIRTTPLLRKLFQDDANAEITWLTHHPEVVPSIVHRVLRFDLKSITCLYADQFDLLLNLDKDPEACALANLVKAKVKKGFCLREGKCYPLDADSKQKYLTGLFDMMSRSNRKSYPEEVFELCGFNYKREPYILDCPKESPNIPNLASPVVGLNTGCGERWPTRLWAMDNWVQLATDLQAAGYSVLLLGGPAEDSSNKKIAEASGAAYFGHFSLRDFIYVVNQCDAVVTQVTMCLHIAIGLNKKVVLMNNIFNPNEFELYGRGSIIEPTVECPCYYKPVCIAERHCMTTITPSRLFEEVKTVLSTGKKNTAPRADLRRPPLEKSQLRARLRKAKIA